MAGDTRGGMTATEAGVHDGPPMTAGSAALIVMTIKTGAVLMTIVMTIGLVAMEPELPDGRSLFLHIQPAGKDCIKMILMEGGKQLSLTNQLRLLLLL